MGSIWSIASIKGSLILCISLISTKRGWVVVKVIKVNYMKLSGIIRKIKCFITSSYLGSPPKNELVLAASKSSDYLRVIVMKDDMRFMNEVKN